MEIKVVKLSEIKPYFNNPRDNKSAVPPTKESIDRFGFIKPIMVDKNGVIICGHTRYLAAFHLGITEVPVIYAEMSDERAKQFRILDNKLAEKSVYDEDELIKELKGMDAPETMQAFFFEDINDMINIDASQFGSMGANNFDNDGSGFYEPGESEEESESQGGYIPEDYGDGEENEEDYDYDSRENGNDSEEDEEPNLYVPFYRDGKTLMKVVCPYCGNTEEIEL